MKILFLDAQIFLLSNKSVSNIFAKMTLYVLGFITLYVHWLSNKFKICKKKTRRNSTKKNNFLKQIFGQRIV